MIPSRPLRLLLATALGAALLAGCGGGADDEDPGAPGGDATGTAVPRREVPADAVALCGAFEEGAAGYRTAAGSGGDEAAGAAGAAGVADALRRWGQALADAEVPPDFDVEQRDGVQIMSATLLAVPDDVTGADAESLTDDLSGGEAEKVAAVTAWVGATCNVAP